MVGKVVGEYNAVEDLVSNNTLPGLVLPTILGAVVAGNQLEVRTRPLVCCCCASSNVPLPPSIPPSLYLRPSTSILDDTIFVSHAYCQNICVMHAYKSSDRILAVSVFVCVRCLCMSVCFSV